MEEPEFKIRIFLAFSEAKSMFLQHLKVSNFCYPKKWPAYQPVFARTPARKSLSDPWVEIELFVGLQTLDGQKGPPR